MGVLDFQQMLTQAVWVREVADTLLQLPHLTQLEVGHITKGKGSVKNIVEYVKLPDDQKKGLAELSEQQKG